MPRGLPARGGFASWAFLRCPRERLVAIIARDPGLKVQNRIVRAQVPIPAETLAPRPVGYRVEVIDYDASNDALYLPAAAAEQRRRRFASYTDTQLLEDPLFHRHNAYALVMRTLARFELALGRRIGWGFNGHQLKVAPLRFRMRMRFYSEQDNASSRLLPRRETHDLHVPLPRRHGPPDATPSWTPPHALHRPVVSRSGGLSRGASPTSWRSSPCSRCRQSVIELMLPGAGPRVDVRALTVESLRASMIFGLAHEVGDGVGSVRGQPLRRIARASAQSRLPRSRGVQGAPSPRGDPRGGRADGVHRHLGEGDFARSSSSAWW